MANDGGGSGGNGTGSGTGGTGDGGANQQQQQQSQGNGSGGTEWTAGLNDEMKGFVQTKGFKDITAVLDSYRNFEKLQGVPQDRLLKLPENLDSAEGRAVFERLGRPKEAKDYSLDVPDTAGGKELAEWFRTVADKGNFTQKQLDTFVKAWNEKSDAHVKSEEQAYKQKLQVEEGNLKRDWGTAYDQNMNIAKAGVQAMGFTQDDVDWMEERKGFEYTMRFLHKMGAATGEANFHSGKGGGNQFMASDQAKAEIKRLTDDQGFVKRYTSGDSEAKQTMERLHKMAYPDTMSL